MFGFGVRNLRRLKDVPPVEIKPITILVGRNASGKSSFLRALPLLRQSVMTRTSSPILWYGDFVDFGSFEGAVSENNSKNRMSFRLQVDNLRINSHRYFVGTNMYVYGGSGPKFNASCDLTIRAHRDTTQLCSVRIQTEDGNAEYELTLGENNAVESFTINGSDILPYFPGIRFVVPQGNILPSVYSTTNRTESSTSGVFLNESSAPASYLSKILRPYLDKRMKDDVINGLITDLLILPEISKQILAEQADRSSVRSWKKLLQDIAGRDIRKLYDQVLIVHKAAQAVPIFRAVSERLREILSEVLYIGPARARSERYYRYQDLAVAEIDPDGKNFPMFLNSLSDTQFKRLSTWVESLFGYKLELFKSAGHIGINVVEGETKTNVVDTGYGVSQILPVLGQIWWSVNKQQDVRQRRPVRDFQLLVIEQPELHLHPAHQALLANALVEGPERARRNPKQTTPRIHFIVETHSETLVNRLGELVATKKLSSDDVQILIFDQSKDDARRTDVRLAHFGEEGQLVDWPYGFFQPSV